MPRNSVLIVLMGILAASVAPAVPIDATSGPLSVAGFNRTIVFGADVPPNINLDYAGGLPAAGPNAFTLTGFNFVSGLETFTSGGYYLAMIRDTREVSLGGLTFAGAGGGTFSGFFDVFVEITFTYTGGGGGASSGEVLGEWGSPGIGVSCAAGNTCTAQLALLASGTWHDDAGGLAIDTIQFTEEAAVPEPAPALLLAAGLAALGCVARRRRRQSSV